MEIALLPGDRRQSVLGELLRQDGHRVTPYAPGTGADAYLFPLPTGHSPVLGELPEGALALVGMAAGAFPGLRLRDYYRSETVLLQNAEITAEGAAALAIERSEDTLWGSRSLVLGYGRIGQALCRRLRGLGSSVTVYARREESRVLARCQGCETLETPEAAGFDFVFNTVPEPILPCVTAGVCMELASAPGGFIDPTGVIRAPGLPGRTAPRTAARVLHEAIQTIFREEGLL